MQRIVRLGPLVVGRPATPDHGSSLPNGSPHLSGAPARRRNPLRLPRRRRQPRAAMMPTRHTRLTCSRRTERAAWRRVGEFVGGGEDEAGKKRPQPRGLGSRGASIVYCQPGNHDEIQFLTNSCCIAKIKESAVLCRMLRIGHTAAYWERTRCGKSTDVTVMRRLFKKRGRSIGGPVNFVNSGLFRVCVPLIVV
jgi:hypothetical protein